MTRMQLVYDICDTMQPERCDVCRKEIADTESRAVTVIGKRKVCDDCAERRNGK